MKNRSHEVLFYLLKVMIIILSTVVCYLSPAVVLLRKVDGGGGNNGKKAKSRPGRKKRVKGTDVKTGAFSLGDGANLISAICILVVRYR